MNEYLIFQPSLFLIIGLVAVIYSIIIPEGLTKKQFQILIVVAVAFVIFTIVHMHYNN